MLPITLYIFWPKMVAPPRDFIRRLRGPLEPGDLEDFLLSSLLVCSSVLLGLPLPLPSHDTLLQQKSWLM